jgi:MFS transporter, DHA1 family, multidrug resistance protein
MPEMSCRRAFWIFAVLIILTSIADRLLFIIVPLFLIDLSFSATEIGLIFTVGGIFLAVFRFLVGKFSDIRGRKTLMSLGLLGDSLATAFFPFVSAIGQFSVIKGIKEVALNLTSTMEDALIGDSFPRESRPRILARLGATFLLGRTISAVAGLLIVTYFSVIYGFYVAAIALFLAFLVFTIFFKEPTKEKITSYRFTTKNISKSLVIITLIGLALYLSFTIAYIPGVFILANSLGLAEADLFIMFLLVYAISSVFVWKTESWIKNHGRETILGITALGIGLFTMVYVIASDMATFFIALMGVAISFYVFRIAYKTTLLDATGRKHRGEQVGFNKMITSFGSIAGPVTGGLLIDLVSLQSAFLVAGFIGLLIIPLSFWLKRIN